MEGVTSYSILDKMQLEEKAILEKEAMLQWMETNKPDLVVMAGAGDIDVLVQQVKNILAS
jgi:UDP-N-acetylmuramate--alanine ligase